MKPLLPSQKVSIYVLLFLALAGVVCAGMCAWISSAIGGMLP